MDRGKVERALQSGEIEIAPLAFMRGRTLANAAVILDEAQNTTSMQMKMFLTRLGENSRMIVTGDPTQIDLPPGQTSGLNEAVELLAKIEDIAHIAFTSADVVRHELVSRIVNAYDAASAKAKSKKESESVSFAIEISVEAGAWQQFSGAEAIVRRAAEAALADTGASGIEIGVVLTDDAKMRALNRTWRGKGYRHQRALVPRACESQTRRRGSRRRGACLRDHRARGGRAAYPGAGPSRASDRARGAASSGSRP